LPQRNRTALLSRIFLAAAALVLLPAASFAQIKVIISGGYVAVYGEILPEFERSTGIQVATSRGPSLGDSPTSIPSQLRRGEAADVVILSREGLAQLIGESRIAEGTDTDLAHVSLGVSVRAGAPKPDITTVEAFKQTLLNAKSVTFTGSTGGIYLQTVLFPRLGIAEQLASKSTTAGVASVAAGEAEIAIQPSSELIPIAGVDFVGLIPAEIQKVNTYAAAVVAVSMQMDAAMRLIRFLTSDAATAAIKKNGMEPVRQ
jgi:molybdate transport system substrate-binding protein